MTWVDMARVTWAIEDALAENVDNFLCFYTKGMHEKVSIKLEAK